MNKLEKKLLLNSDILESQVKSDVLESQDFYNLMQRYRHTPMTNQEEVVNSFEEIKTWIRCNYKNNR